MTKTPTIEVHGNTENDLERAQWLRDIYDAVCQHVRNRDEPMHEVCYWPGSIEKIDHTPITMTVYWSDAISMSCFQWAFEAAWNDLGDDTPVQHIAMDDFHDREPDSIEASQ